MIRAWVLILAGLLSACGDDVVLPAAPQLSTQQSRELGATAGAGEGPHAVVSRRDVALAVAGRELLLNLYFPLDGEAFPLLLFSHGNWSDKDSYDALLRHWASHGYAVVTTNHADCCGAPRGIFNSLRYGQFGLVQRRVEELQLLLDSVTQLESMLPAFNGKANPSQLAIAGHSFGAFTAQQWGGATAVDPETGRHVGSLRAEVSAVIALSPPGPMFDIITEDSWQTLASPTLVTTGTWDIQPAFWPDWRSHLLSYETSPPQGKYALVVQGADHYLGNLICRTERDALPQTDALNAVLAATTTFLDAYVKRDEGALERLDGGLFKGVDEFVALSARTE